MLVVGVVIGVPELGNNITTTNNNNNLLKHTQTDINLKVLGRGRPKQI